MSLSERCSLLTLAYHSTGEVKGETMNEENKYYVYLHRTNSKGEVFYVGSGCGKRAQSLAGRSIPWCEVTKNNLWYFTIVKQNLSKSEARDLELQLIKHYDPLGNVRKVSIESKEFDKDLVYILTNFEYNEDSPSGLVYKRDSRMKGRKIKLKGEVAGSLHSVSQRYRISINNQRRFTYRIVWLLCKGEDPVNFTIDHIDGDTLNNKISNLRKVTQVVNCKNIKMRADNKTGHTNISYRNDNFSVMVKVFGKVIRKSFSVLKYGEEVALALAIEYKHKCFISAINSGEDYTERHIGEYTKHQAIADYSSETITNILEAPRLNSNNKSGIPNISYLVRNGKVSVVAQKTINGKILTKKMSIDKHGMENVMNTLTNWLTTLK